MRWFGFARSPFRLLVRARRRLRKWVERRRASRRYVPVYTLWRSWCDEITIGGKCLIGALIVAGLGTVTVQLPIYQILCALVALTLISLFGGFLSLPVVRVDGTFPSRTVAGEPVRVELQVTNRSSWRTIYDVGVSLFDPPASIVTDPTAPVVDCLAPRATVDYPLTFKPLKRGLYQLPPPRPFTTFPFNLFRIGKPVRGPRQGLLVLPRFMPLDTIDIPASLRHQPGGIALTSNVGESPEYIGNREYVAGEPVRRLDFRSWARLGRPVVREFQEEFYCRIALILDTWISSPRAAPPSGYDKLETAVSLTAAVADALSNGEYLIDLFAAGPELHIFRAGRHTAHLENILEILACVEPCPEDMLESVTSGLIDELANISTAVCVFLEWNEPRRELVRRILEAGCALKVLLVREPDDATMIDGEVPIEAVTPAQVRAGGVSSL